MNYMREKPCIYKHTCGWDICMGEDCPEYIAKTKDNKWYEDEDGERKE